MIKISRKCNLKVNIVNDVFVFETTYLINLNALQAYNLWSHHHNASYETFCTLVEEIVLLQLGYKGKV